MSNLQQERLMLVLASVAGDVVKQDEASVYLAHIRAAADDGGCPVREYRPRRNHTMRPRDNSAAYPGDNPCQAWSIGVWPATDTAQDSLHRRDDQRF